MNRTYTYRLDDHSITLIKGIQIQLPVNMLLNGQLFSMTLSESDGEHAVYTDQNAKALFCFDEDCVRIQFSCAFSECTPIFDAVLFQGGLKIKNFDRVLSTQPRNNEGLNMEMFRHLPDISSNGYFTPPELNLILGSKDGWMGLGLLDLPDSKICRLNNDLSFFVEGCGGNKRVESYHSPELLLTFPQDEWQAVSLFREKLIAYGRYTPSKPPFSRNPEWWKYPLICTYGDQLVMDCVGALIDQNWVKRFVETAEKQWGLEYINLVIDDSWQHIQTFTPETDSVRFPDMRALADELHQRGHRLILWTQPLFENILTGVPEPLSRKMGMLTDCSPSPTATAYFHGASMIDYTHDSARDFLRKVCETLFGEGDGQFHADGVKLDFMGTLRDPRLTQGYAHPERGIGIRELYLFLRMFSEEARRVRPDVLIDCTTGDPRFEGFMTHCRLHDTHCGVEEKELRARLVSLACPDLLIDSDGALMYSHWLARHYINAAIYAIPSNYYLRGYQDFHEWENGSNVSHEEALQTDLTARQKMAFGRLFSIARYRPDGHAVTDGNGSWRLIDDRGRINGISLYGDTVIFYPTRPGETGCFFTMRDEAMTLPLYGRRIAQMEPAPFRDFCVPDYARDRVTVHLLPGIVHTWIWNEDEKGIETSFGMAEDETNYVN